MTNLFGKVLKMNKVFKQIIFNILDYIREWEACLMVTSQNPNHWFYTKTTEICNSIEKKLER